MKINTRPLLFDLFNQWPQRYNMQGERKSADRGVEGLGIGTWGRGDRARLGGKELGTDCWHRTGQRKEMNLCKSLPTQTILWCCKSWWPKTSNGLFIKHWFQSYDIEIEQILPFCSFVTIDQENHPQKKHPQKNPHRTLKQTKKQINRNKQTKTTTTTTPKTKPKTSSKPFLIPPPKHLIFFLIYLAIKKWAHFHLFVQIRSLIQWKLNSIWHRPQTWSVLEIQINSYKSVFFFLINSGQCNSVFSSEEINISTRIRIFINSLWVAGFDFLFLIYWKLKSLSSRKLYSFSFRYKPSKHNREQKITQKMIHVSLYVKNNLFAETHEVLGKYLIKLYPTGISLWVTHIRQKTSNIIQGWQVKERLLSCQPQWIFD